MAEEQLIELERLHDGQLGESGRQEGEAERHYVATSKLALDEALEWLRAEYRVAECFAVE